MIDLTPKQRVSLAVVAFLTLGAATAFSFAPPTINGEIPSQATVVEPLALDRPVIGASDHGIFHRQDRIQRGDTLALVLQRLGAHDPGFLAFARTDRAAHRLLQLRPGRTIAAELDGEGRIRRFWSLVDDGDSASSDDDAKASPGRRVVISRTAGADGSRGDGFVARDEPVRLERSVEMRGFEIRSSLFSATDEAGIPDAVATQMADILGGDVDFHRDLRRGDSIRVVWESFRIAEGLDPAVAGRVLAVEMMHRGRKLEAVWFDRGNGRGGDYFTPDGRSIRKSFLRSPLEFSRVSSGFSTSRLHPIHNDWRAHRGVDYAAPTGTKVRSIADGVIESAGRKGGYGNVVSVRHANKTVSLYAHLSAFAPGLKPGARIAQGDLVGLVGSTGWATGPHLHYEFIVDGVNVDPLKVALPQALPVGGGEQAAFRTQADAQLRRIALLSAPQIARFE